MEAYFDPMTGEEIFEYTDSNGDIITRSLHDIAQDSSLALDVYLNAYEAGAIYRATVQSLREKHTRLVG